ncbi:hypothetical protein pb186bvf_000671 [Paramecium bursaria]
MIGSWEIRDEFIRDFYKTRQQKQNEKAQQDKRNSNEYIEQQLEINNQLKYLQSCVLLYKRKSDAIRIYQEIKAYEESISQMNQKIEFEMRTAAQFSKMYVEAKNCLNEQLQVIQNLEQQNVDKDSEIMILKQHSSRQKQIAKPKEEDPEKQKLIDELKQKQIVHRRKIKILRNRLEPFGRNSSQRRAYNRILWKVENRLLNTFIKIIKYTLNYIQRKYIKNTKNNLFKNLIYTRAKILMDKLLQSQQQLSNITTPRQLNDNPQPILTVRQQMIPIAENEEFGSYTDCLLEPKVNNNQIQQQSKLLSLQLLSQKYGDQSLKCNLRETVEGLDLLCQQNDLGITASIA